MFDAIVNGMLGGLLVIVALMAGNYLVRWIERGVKREKGVTGYEVHESFQMRQARKRKAKGGCTHG